MRTTFTADGVSVTSKVGPPPPLASAGHPRGPWEEWVPAQLWLLQPRLWYPDPIFSHVPWGLPSGPSPTQWSLHGLTCPCSEKTQTHLLRLGSRVITSTWKPALTTTPRPWPCRVSSVLCPGVFLCSLPTCPPPSQLSDAASIGAGQLQASFFHVSRFLTESRWILSIHWTDKVSDLLVTLDKGKAFVEKINSL